MDDEGDESRIGSMDLNLYLGLPRSPGPRVLDLGSDLALGSILVPSSPSAADADADANAGDSRSLMDIGGPEPYSPSNASYDAVQPSSEHAPYTPSYEPIGPSYIPIPPIDEEDEEEEPDNPYSPSDVQPLQLSQEEGNESMAQNGVSHSLYGSASPPGLVDEPHVPYSPPYVPLLATPQGHNVPALNGDESSGRADGSSSQRDSIQYPVLRFRRLIESQHRLRLRRRFRSSFSIGSERPDLGWHYPSTIPEPPAQESLGKNKVAEEGVVAEGSEEDSEDKSKGAANFECNICLDLAKDPVVTSCGHLFCWPCLYQWLHLHSEHKECPVCKGEVTESNMTPIYGRGSSEAGQESKYGENGQHVLKIPPRPRGNRFESFRQHFRPISTRRLGDGSWRRLFDARMPNSDRFEGHVDPSMHDMFDIGQRRLLARLRTDIMQRRERNLERRLNTGDSLLHRNVTPEPQNNHSSLPAQDGAADLWPRFSLYDLGRVVERLASNTNRNGASGSSVSPPNLEPQVGRPSVAAAIATDQASASSTMAVIQGDVAVPDGSAEPNSAGSSRSLRRRGRSGTSGSLDVDGGALHVRKRRRLN